MVMGVNKTLDLVKLLMSFTNCEMDVVRSVDTSESHRILRPCLVKGTKS